MQIRESEEDLNFKILCGMDPKASDLSNLYRPRSNTTFTLHSNSGAGD